MLVHLRIQNYALIDDITIDFKKGLTTITGETGAGKSILLGALSLVLGNRSDSNSLKDKTKKCIVEAEFDVIAYHMEHILDKQGLDYNEHTYIRREILPNGKSRAFINDTPVTLDVLKLIAHMLIDIHSQYENQQITDINYYYNIIDILSEHKTTTLEVYQDVYISYQKAKQKLEELFNYQKEIKQTSEYNNFVFNELQELKLRENLQEELEEQVDQLSNSKDINENILQINELLQEENQGIITSVNQVKNILSKLSSFGKNYQKLNERIQPIYTELDDINREVSSLVDTVEPNPDKLNTLNSQLQKLYDVQKKHKVSTTKELIDLKQTLEKKIASSENIEEDIEQQQSLTKELEQKLLDLGEKLFKKRSNTIPKLKKKLEQFLAYLGMENATFQITLEKINGFQPNGVDSLQILFSANKGGTHGEIKKIASGGERSRIMLAIKYIISEYINLPTIIFDEIDTGVSGEISVKMSQVMKQLASRMQVVTITHLPQIAAKGNTHLKVSKNVENNITSTKIQELTVSERILEIAEMLGGKDISESAKQHARELLGLS